MLMKLDSKITLKIIERLEVSIKEECGPLNDIQTVMYWLDAVAQCYRIMLDNPTACQSLDNLNLCIDDARRAFSVLLDMAFLDLRLKVEIAEANK